MQNLDISHEMRFFSPDGTRLFLTAQECICFLSAANHEHPENHMFCLVLHYSDCRPSEALKLILGRFRVDVKAHLLEYESYHNLSDGQTNDGSCRIAKANEYAVQAILDQLETM
jgi:hypothetical protein